MPQGVQLLDTLLECDSSEERARLVRRPASFASQEKPGELSVLVMSSRLCPAAT
jgi:hypothetical protein